MPHLKEYGDKLMDDDITESKRKSTPYHEQCLGCIVQNECKAVVDKLGSNIECIRSKITKLKPYDCIQQIFKEV